METNKEELDVLRQNLEVLNADRMEELRALGVGINEIVMLQLQIQAMMLTIAEVTGVPMIDIAAVFNYQCTEALYSFLHGIDIEQVKAEKARQTLLGGMKFNGGPTNGNPIQ